MNINSNRVDYEPMQNNGVGSYVKWIAYMQLFQFIFMILIFTFMSLTFSYTTSQLQQITSSFINTTRLINQEISTLSPQAQTFFNEGTIFINTTKPLAVGLTKCITAFCR